VVTTSPAPPTTRPEGREEVAAVPGEVTGRTGSRSGTSRLATLERRLATLGRRLGTLGRRLPRWVAPVGVGGLAVTVCVVLAVVDPEDRQGWTPRCPFRTATGLDCPGCGGTRAVTALVRGEPALAFEHNLATMLLLPLLAYGWVAWVATSLGWRRTRLELPTWSAWVIAGGLALFTVARNVPWGPVSWLGSGAG
jgi:hypothetical protein